MHLRRVAGMVLLVISVAGGAALVVNGAQTVTYEGCLECSINQFISGDACVQVGHEATGLTLCKLTTFSNGMTYCATSGSACFNVNVSGGGGGAGGGGGGGGSSCAIQPGAVCPAWCQSCEPLSY